MEPGYTAVTKEVGIELKDGNLGGKVRIASLVVTSTDEQPLASSSLAGKEDNTMQGLWEGSGGGRLMAVASQQHGVLPTKTPVSFVMWFNHLKACKRDSRQHHWF